MYSRNFLSTGNTWFWSPSGPWTQICLPTYEIDPHICNRSRKKGKIHTIYPYSLGKWGIIGWSWQRNRDQWLIKDQRRHFLEKNFHTSIWIFRNFNAKVTLIKPKYSQSWRYFADSKKLLKIRIKLQKFSVNGIYSILISGKSLNPNLSPDSRD